MQDISLNRIFRLTQYPHQDNKWQQNSKYRPCQGKKRDRDKSQTKIHQDKYTNLKLFTWFFHPRLVPHYTMQSTAWHWPGLGERDLSPVSHSPIFLSFLGAVNHIQPLLSRAYTRVLVPSPVLTWKRKGFVYILPFLIIYFISPLVAIFG